MSYGQLVTKNTSSLDIPNLTWSYIGAGTLIGPLSLGTFSAQTNLGANFVFDDYAGQATKNTGVTISTPTQNRGFVTTPAAIPESASMLLIGTGLIGLAFCRRRFRV